VAKVRMVTATHTPKIMRTRCLDVSRIEPAEIVMGTIQTIVKMGAYRGQSNRMPIVRKMTHRAMVNKALFAAIRSKSVFVGMVK